MGGSNSTPIIPAYCTDSGRSQAFSLQDLSSVPVGGTKEMSHGCGANIGGTAGGSGYDNLTGHGMSWPNNGEFDWGGLGSSCSMCSLEYGCDNCSGVYTVSGKRGTVKRTSYKGDQTACCTLQPSDGTYNGNTCDPSYKASNYSSGACNNPMQTYCSQGSNIVTDPNCVTWANVVGDGNSYVSAAMKTYCSSGANIAGTACGNWLNANKATEQSWYDTQVAKYCKATPTDKSFCGCYNLSTVWTEGPLTAGSIKPSCYVPECANGTTAYRSATMQADAKTCPSLAICNQTLTANMTNAQVSALNQTCNIVQSTSTNNTAGETAGKTSSGSSGTTNNSAAATTTKASSLFSLVNIIIAIIICIILSSMCGGVIYAVA